MKPMKESRDENEETITIDPVLASFARNVQHEAVPMAPPLRGSIDEDRIYQAVNQVHWTNLREVAKKAPPCVPVVVDLSPVEAPGDSGTEPASGTNCAGNATTIPGRVMPAAAVQ